MKLKLASIDGVRKEFIERTDTAEEAMNVIRDELYYHQPKDVARYTGLALGTIYAIRSGRTLWPRPHTFFTLIRFLDLEMYLKKKGEP
jgi:hypothetical protein